MSTTKKRPANRTAKAGRRGKKSVSPTSISHERAGCNGKHDDGDAWDSLCDVLCATGPAWPSFRAANNALAKELFKITKAEHPMTLRHLNYLAIGYGLVANTPEQYRRIGRIMTRLRDARVVPFDWIVDGIRATLKPSSWSGLGDFSDTIRDAYRKDFWARMPHHVTVFAEKDAIAGTIQPITEKYDVSLCVTRGYVSISYAAGLADELSRIDKPVYLFWCGDHDPSGYDIERDCRAKLTRYGAGDFEWQRLAICESDFADFGLIELPVKMGDRRASKFIAEHGRRCAELDALPASELRRRVEGAILDHVNAEQWKRLQEIEAVEKASILDFVGRWNGKSNLGSVS